MLTPSDKAMRVNQVYSQLNRKFEEEETQRRAAQEKIPYMNLFGYPVDAQALNLLSHEEAETFESAIFFKEGRSAKLGVIKPLPKNNPIFKRLIEGGYNIEQFMISKSSLDHLMQGYSTIIKTKQRAQDIKILSGDKRFQAKNLKDLGHNFTTVSATELMEVILGAALVLNSSDIHIEPEGAIVKIRYRMDGVLQDVAGLNLDLLHPLISRIKILSKMKLNITTTPQDGSFGLAFDQSHVDIRVSILPSAYGESIVMRILRQDKGALKFEELGIMGLARERILKELEKPNGMVLTTGPTGSGKTTTLYALLNQLNEPGVKVITLEDPVEYKIAGITQTPIDAAAGMTFATGLRAILRQDPDIVMIGEMRDLETAETATQAALTGHIVLSTLHTNDAPSAIPRLLDMGVRSFTLAPAINAIIGQRLVRKICTYCKEQYHLPDTIQKRVEMILKVVPKSASADIPPKLVFYHSRGCEKCNGLGYKGRMGVYEVFIISDEIEKLITNGATTSEVKNTAIREGMLTMSQDGLLKALQGLTDVEEVFRVTED